MSAYATKQEVQVIVDKAVADLSDIIGSFAQQVDARFNTLEVKAVNLETRLGGVEKQLIDLRESHLRLLNTIDGFVTRIDHYETEQLKVCRWYRPQTA